MNDTNKMPLTSIILVNFNGSNDTIECLESINKIRYSNYNVFVIDNNSRDTEKQKLVNFFHKDNVKKMKLILNHTNLGFSGANNIGIKLALAENAHYVCLLNNDTIVDDEFLINMVEIAERNYEIGSVCPMIREYYNRERISYGGGEINYFKGSVFIYGINSYDVSLMNKSRYITFASGCCMLLKRQLLTKIGFLPEKYFLYFEDTEYSIKISKSNYKIWYDSTTAIYHKESVSTGKGSSIYQYYFVRNRLLFIKNNFGNKEKISAYPITILYIIKKILKNEFGIKNVIDAVKDFGVGKTGKRLENEDVPDER